MNIAITGASGFLGRRLYRLLLADGHRLKVLVHHGEDDFKNPQTGLVYGDVRDPEGIARLVKDCEVVYHLAAALSIGEKDAQHVRDVNIVGTQAVANACRRQGVSRLVHLSSIKTLDSPHPAALLDESAPLIKGSSLVYDASKAEAERAVLRAMDEGLDAVILNPTAVIGPYDHGPSYLGQALIKIYKGSFPLLVSGGYDFVDVRDVAAAALSAGTNGCPGGRYILSGTWLSIRELAGFASRHASRNIVKPAVPLPLARMALPFVKAFAAATGKQPLFTADSLENLRTAPRNISNEKAGRELGFQPRPIAETLADTFDWFIRNNMLK